MSGVTRFDRVVALLVSLDDWVQAPRRSATDRLAAGGDLPTKVVECRSCSGSGRLRGRKGDEICGRCEGRGSVVVDVMTGRQAVRRPPIDEMSGAEVREEIRRTLTDEASDFEHRRDRQRRVRHVLEQIEEESSESWKGLDPEEWERRKRAFERKGSYRELRAALAALWRVDELGWRAVRAVYGPDHELRSVGRALQERADAAVGWLVERMPGEIRVPLAVAGSGRWSNGTSDARARRDGEVRRLAGRLSQAEIARRVGLSQAQVSRILAGRRLAS